MEDERSKHVAQPSQLFSFLLKFHSRVFDFGKETVNFKPHGRIEDAIPRPLFYLDPKLGPTYRLGGSGGPEITYDQPVMIVQLG